MSARNGVFGLKYLRANILRRTQLEIFVVVGAFIKDKRERSMIKCIREIRISLSVCPLLLSLICSST